MSKQGKSSMEYAIEALTKDLQNGDYLRQTSPRDFDAEGYFAGFQDQRKARSIWSSTVIPRLISSSHGELRQVGLALQKKWASKSYRKQLDKARAQAEVVLDSVHKHQARILDHSYKDLCHTLQRREESFTEAKSTTSVTSTSRNDHVGTIALTHEHKEKEQLENADLLDKSKGVAPDKDDLAELDKNRATLDLEKDVEEKTIKRDDASNVVESEDEETGDTEDGSFLAPFTEQDRKSFADTFLKIQNKVLLPSGNHVEDVLFAAGVTKNQHSLLHSFIIDVDDDSVRELFQEEDWTFIMKEQNMSVELDDKDIVKTLDALKDAGSAEAIMEILNHRPLRLGNAYRMDHDYELKWLFDSVSKWIDIYTMPFSVFTSDATLEYFWRSQVWGVLDTLFYDIPNTLMIGGEGHGIESKQRRNQQQPGRTLRKAGGSKSDGYLRSFGSTKSDWLTIEGARNWDPFAKKYKMEAYWKLARQMHDIFRARTADQDPSTLKNFRTYGLIFGGPTIQIHVMASLGGASTVFRRRRPLTLAASIESFEENVVMLEIFMLLKRDIVRTLTPQRKRVSAMDLFKGTTTILDSEPISFTIPLAHPSPKKRRA
ncbi:hypothetical protein K457DRAFT_30792 [Linnemannia elongata AG-77]|uniref:Uncharacterized protein n=1 Tax=Linnemannia elongata AG-77 TaxID=1314771 RepID=A0A197K219_9FUNG|nr:hypothetical protein K457DRAFT_30792 [Linnemannia elongata AG-77]